MSITTTLSDRFAGGGLTVSDIQVGDELVVWNPYGGRRDSSGRKPGSTTRYRISTAHYDTRARYEGRFVKVAAEEGTTEAGTVYFHFLAYRVNQKTGASFGRNNWRCENRARITAIYRNGEAL